jgi:hypothetical protein
MHWTLQKPTTPGLYWYRSQQNTAPQDFQTFKIEWDGRKHHWLAQTIGRGIVALDSCNGEWYGPIAPPANDPAITAENRRNARIAVQLQHGGSFYVENTIPNDLAIALSKKLKTLHKKGSSIPVNLRAKITGLLRELIKFAEAPPDQDRTVSIGH